MIHSCSTHVYRTRDMLPRRPHNATLSLLLPALHRTHGGRRRVVHLELKVKIWFDVTTGPNLVLPLG